MVGEIIVRIVSSLLPTAVSYNVPKKDTEFVMLVLVIHADRVLLAVVVIAIVMVVILSRTALSAT